MIVTKVLCDRCRDAIDEPHPDRIQIQSYSMEPSNSYGKKAVGYKSTGTLHLCKPCRNAFDAFMEPIKGVLR